MPDAIGTFLPPLLRAPLFGLLFWWFVLALGARILKALRLSSPNLTIWEQGFLALAVGAGSLQFVPYALAALDQLTPNVLRWTCLILLVLASPDMFRVARSCARHVRGLSLGAQPKWALPWAGLLAGLLGILLLQALALRAIGDDDGYHLNAPKRWLEDGNLSYLASYTHTNAAMGFEMLYAVALAVSDTTAAKLLHYVAGLWLFLGLWLSARRLGQRFAGPLAISLLMVATPFCDLPVLFGVAYVDLPTCWMMTASVLLWIIWLEHEDPRLIVCLALCTGFAGSFKITASTAGVAWAVALFYYEAKRGKALLGSFIQVARFGLIAAAPVLPWLFRNWRMTGNPLYPMGSSVMPTRDWSAAQADVLGRYVRLYAWGVAAGDRLTEGNRKALLLLTIGLLCLGLGVAMVFAKKWVFRSLLLVALISTVATVAVTGLIFRYWLPATLCAVLVFCVIAAARVAPWPRAKWFAVSAIMLLALVVQLRKSPDLGRNFRLATGLRTLDEEYAEDPFWRMWQHVNANVPRDAHVLVGAFYTTFGSSSFGCYYLGPRCYVTDSHLQTYINLQDWPSFTASLRRAGIKYLLVSDQQFTPGRHGFSFTGNRNEFPFCRRLADESGQKLFQEGHLQFYRVSP
jgi:hypothetical protein